MKALVAPGPRRKPSQTRGERRVEAIVDAAAALLAEVGYEALTLTDVAERSGSAIGSLYQYFSNKEQLVDAVADRIVARYRALPAAVLDASLANVSVENFVSSLIEPLAALAIDSPAVAEVMDRIVARTPSLDSEVAARLEAILVARDLALPAAERRLVVRITMETLRTGMRLIARSPKAGRRAVIAELNTLLASYLRARIGYR